MDNGFRAKPEEEYPLLVSIVRLIIDIRDGIIRIYFIEGVYLCKLMITRWVKHRLRIW